MLNTRCITLALAGIFAMPAQAHVTLRPDTASADSYFQADFTVPHACGTGTATLALRVQIPPGIYSVKPQFKPGWTVTTRSRKVDPPVKAHHGPDITEAVSEVEWRGGPLPDALFDRFGLIVKLPSGEQTLSFPVTQECDQGTVQWIDAPGGEHPAPSVRVLTGAAK